MHQLAEIVAHSPELHAVLGLHFCLGQNVISEQGEKRCCETKCNHFRATCTYMQLRAHLPIVCRIQNAVRHPHPHKL